MKNKYTGEVTIAGKKYQCEVINGVPYIDGMTVDAFIDTLPIETLVDAAIVGRALSWNNKKVSPSPQQMFNELHQSKNN